MKHVVVLRLASPELPRPEGWGIHNETCKGSLGSERLFLFRCEGIGIGNPNKFSGVFFFGTFLLHPKGTCHFVRANSKRKIPATGALNIVVNNMKKYSWGAATGSAARA